LSNIDHYDYFSHDSIALTLFIICFLPCFRVVVVGSDRKRVAPAAHKHPYKPANQAGLRLKGAAAL
jgi:hypothetical protein